MTKASFVIIALLVSGSSANATVRNFFAPESDAFCKAQGFETALIFQRESAAETVKLGNGAFCTGPACTSFKQIKCYSAGNAVASG